MVFRSRKVPGGLNWKAQRPGNKSQSVSRTSRTLSSDLMLFIANSAFNISQHFLIYPSIKPLCSILLSPFYNLSGWSIFSFSFLWFTTRCMSRGPSLVYVLIFSFQLSLKLSIGILNVHVVFATLIFILTLIFNNDIAYYPTMIVIKQSVWH